MSFLFNGPLGCPADGRVELIGAPGFRAFICFHCGAVYPSNHIHACGGPVRVPSGNKWVDDLLVSLETTLGPIIKKLVRDAVSAEVARNCGPVVAQMIRMNIPESLLGSATRAVDSVGDVVTPLREMSERVSDAATVIESKTSVLADSAVTFLEEATRLLRKADEGISSYLGGGLIDHIIRALSLIVDCVCGAYAGGTGIMRLIFRVLGELGVTAAVISELVSMYQPAIDWLSSLMSSMQKRTEDMYGGFKSKWENASTSASLATNPGSCRPWALCENNCHYVYVEYPMGADYRAPCPERVVAMASSTFDLYPFLFSVIGASLFGSVAPAHVIKKMVDTFRLANLTTPVYKHIGDVFTDCLSLLPWCVRAFICEYCPSESLRLKLGGTASLKVFVESCHSILTPEVEANLPFVQEDVDKILNLHKVGQEILTACVHNPELGGGFLHSTVTSLMVKLSRFVESIHVKKGVLGTRLTPFCVSLFGAPGVGKSSVAPLFHAVMVPPEIPLTKRVYVRNPALKHWDGYMGQYLTQYDDFGQMVDGEDLNELIVAVSSATCPLSMASLTSGASGGGKGTCFTSEALLVLTNTAYCGNSNVVTNVAAVNRRRHLLFEVVCPEGVQREADQSHLVFVLRDPVDPRVPGREMSLVSALAHVKKCKREHERKEAMLANPALRSEILAKVDNYCAQTEYLAAAIVERERVQAEVAQRLAVVAQADGDDVTLEAIYNRRIYRAMLPLVAHPAGKSKDIQALSDSLVLPGKTVDDAKLQSLCESATDEEIQLLKHAFQLRSKHDLSYVFDCKRLSVRNGEIFFSDDIRDKNDVAKILVKIEEDFNIIKSRWLDKHPRCARALEMCAFLAVMGIPLTLMWKFWPKLTELFQPTSLTVPESVSERVKRRRHHQSYKRVVAESLVVLENVVDDKTARSEIKDKVRPYLKRCDLLKENLRNGSVSLSPEYIDEIYGGYLEVCDILVKEYGMPLNGIAKRKLFTTVVPESSVDPNALDVSASIRNNVVYLGTIAGDGTRGMCAVMVSGAVALAPRHFFSTESGKILSQGTIITVTGVDGNTTPFAFDQRRLVPLRVDGRVKDCVLYDFGFSCRRYPTITQHFWSNKNVEFMPPSPCELLSFDYKTNSARTVFLANVQVRKHLGVTYTHALGVLNPEVFNLPIGLVYQAPTGYGSCGSPIVAHNTNMAQKLLGVHVAGVLATTQCYGEIVTLEMIDVALAQLKVVPLSPLIVNEGVRPMIVAQGALTARGAFQQRRCPRASTTSRIVPSPLFDLVRNHTKEPAVLTPYDERLEISRSLLLEGVEKFGHETIPMDVDLLRASAMHVEERIRSVLAFEPSLRVLTESEAINGVPSLRNMDALNMNSSPGYPYTMRNAGGGKRTLFSGGEGCLEICDAELRERLDHRRREAMCGRRVESIWQACLKDELRPLDKIRKGKTRLFVFGPLDMVILSREMMLSFCGVLYRNHHRLAFAPGVDPFSLEWTSLMDSLLNVSPNIFGGDFSNYDGTLSADVIEQVLDLINRLYDDGETNAMVRRVLFEEYVHTDILCLNSVVQKRRGNPSGNPLTTVINSLVNEILMAYHWLKLAPPDKRDLFFYRDAVRAKFYGDDNLVAVHPSASGFFNMLSVSSSMKEIGMEYTLPDKSGVAQKEFLDFESITFLKCGFRREGGFFYPTMDPDTIYELTNWVSAGGDSLLLCQESCTDALRMAFFYGKEWFDRFRGEIQRAVQDAGIDLNLPSYAYYFDMFTRRKQLPSFICSDLGSDIYFEYPHAVIAQMDLAPQDNSVLTTGVGASSVQKTDGIVNITGTDPVEGTRVGLSEASREAEKILSDTTWTMESLVRKDAFVGQYAWNTTQVQGVNLASFQVPQDLIVTNSVAHTPFNIFVYWRGRARVKFLVNGTRFHSGRVICYFVPLMSNTSVAAWHGVSQPAQTAVNHVFLDPSDSTAAELLVDFVSPVSFINLRTFSGDPIGILGTLNVTVFNPLFTGAGTSTSVNVAVTVSFEDSLFKIPMPVGDANLMLAEARLWKELRRVQKSLKGVSKTIRLEMMEELLGEDFVVAQGNTLTNTYNNNIRDSTVKTIGGGQEGTAIGQTGEANISALDDPNINLAPPPVVRSPLGYFSNSTNLEFNERLALCPGPRPLANNETFSSSNDEMDISYLCQRLNWYNTIIWNTTLPSGNLLDYEYLTCLPGSLGSWVVGIPIYPTTLEFVSTKFTYWSGDLIFRFQIVATPMHTGRLFFGIHYGVVNVPSYDDALSTYGAYIDLSDERRDYTFRVPYYSHKPMLRVPHGQAGSTYIPVFSMGVYSLYVVNPLVAVAGTSTEVAINVWIAGAENFRLHVLGGNNASVVLNTDWPTLPSSGQVVAQMDRKDVKNEEIIVLAPMSSGATVYPAGEQIKSLGDVIKRYVPVMDFQTRELMLGQNLGFIQPFNADVAGMFLWPRQWTQANIQFASGESSGYWTNRWRHSAGLISWFGSMYRGFTGGFRLRVQYNPNVNNEWVTAVTQTTSSSTTPGYGVQIPLSSTVVVPPTGYISTESSRFSVAFYPENLGQNVQDSNVAFQQAYVGSENTPSLLGYYDQRPFSPVNTYGPVSESLLNISPPFTFSDQAANYISVEVPFVSYYKFLMIPQQGEALLQQNDYCSLGNIAITPPVPQRASLTPGNVEVINAVNQRGSFEIWGSCSDEFAFGLYLGPPILNIIGPFGRDTYSSSVKR